MKERGALAEFAERLHPEVAADIGRWERDRELAKLYASLDGSGSYRSFLDTLAEAVVARRLRAAGCDFRFEVPTPNGRACDFEVTTPGRDPVYLHVKRADTEKPARKRLTISSRLRYLERLERPYVVSVRWQEGASDDAMARLVRSARDFILHARVGDELVVHDDAGHEIGGVLIVAPWEGPHVSLAIGLPSGFIDEAERMRRLLRRAHRQFMPKAVNAALICSSHADELEDFKSALLGSHVERWDAFPPHGRRIAHGRAADGFWHGSRYADSRTAGWFHLDPAARDIDARWIHRQEPALDAPTRAMLEELV